MMKRQLLARPINPIRARVIENQIPSPKKEQDWTLDALGNWGNLLEKANGSTMLNQNRSHNDANEITQIDASSTHVAHDGAGNMTKVPKPSSWSAHYDLSYDAWNRLVLVKDGAATVAEFKYDGLNRRIIPATPAVTYDYYLTTSGNYGCGDTAAGAGEWSLRSPVPYTPRRGTSILFRLGA